MCLWGGYHTFLFGSGTKLFEKVPGFLPGVPEFKTILKVPGFGFFSGKTCKNTAYPEIVFCYIARKITYFILPHIVLYFIFRHSFFVGIVSQRAHKDAHLFCLSFFSCHVLCLLFSFYAQADYYILILA